MSERSSDRRDRSMLATLRKAPGFVTKTVERIVATRRLERRFRERPNHHALSTQAATDAVAEADRILFLCWGNVCRSPLAERYLRRRLEASGIDGVRVESAGLGEAADRPSPADGVAAAATRDVDLSDHRSRRTDAEQVGASDVVFVMDYYNYYLLLTQYPEAADRTFFLGALAGEDAPTIIPDPHGEGRAAFEHAYDAIVAAVDRVVESLPGSSGVE